MNVILTHPDGTVVTISLPAPLGTVAKLMKATADLGFELPPQRDGELTPWSDGAVGFEG